MSAALISLALRMGDNALILAQQNSKWCGYAPTLEEDIALANIALDLIGQARLWFGFVGEIERPQGGQTEGKGRKEDQLAFHRDASEFRNAYLVEQKNGDYGRTVMRQYLFDIWHEARSADLCDSSNKAVAEIAQKSKNEVEYHVRRSRNLVLRLGAGSDESIKHMQGALEYLWPSFGSLFEDGEMDAELEDNAVASKPSSFFDLVLNKIKEDISTTELTIPQSMYFHKGAVNGIHSENLGHILSDMQFLQRAYPGFEW